MSWRATAYVADIVDNITRAEKLLLICLSNRFNDDEHCAWISVPRLARESLMSERTAHRALETLTVKGFLTIGLRTGQSSVYLINGLDENLPTPDKLAGVNNWRGRPDLWGLPLTKEGPTPDISGGDLAPPPLTELWHPTPDIAMAPKPKENKQLEPSKNGEPEKRANPSAAGSRGRNDVQDHVAPAREQTPARPAAPERDQEEAGIDRVTGFALALSHQCQPDEIRDIALGEENEYVIIGGPQSAVDALRASRLIALDRAAKRIGYRGVKYSAAAAS